MKKKIAIQLTNVSKKYMLHHQKPTFVENLFNRKKNEEFWALNKINLTIKKGEKVGIIGPNGSGKTTLLEVIAGITTPTCGTVKTEGKIVSLIELEAGFHPDLTGEENIFLNGLLIGMSKKEVKRNLANIVSFANIGTFIDTPMYTYSDGMKLRLGFSIAVHAKPDILILDEAVNVGDREFQKKSQAKISEFFKRGKTIVIVSHWIEFIKKYCNRFITMKKGRLPMTEKRRLLRI